MNTIYISKPHFSDLPSNHLHYLDILTYVAIKSFKNSTDELCYPSYETIAEIMGASKGHVMNSVNRLNKSTFLYAYKFPRNSRKSNHYSFPKFALNDKIPREIFNLDLTLHEKAMILVLRQFCVGLPTSIFANIKTIANHIGVTYKTIYTQVNSLIEKGSVIKKCHKIDKRWDTLELSDQMDWWFIYDLPPIDNNKKEKVSVMIT